MIRRIRAELPAREFPHAVLEYCLNHELLAEDARVIVGVSGGPDSLALLHALHEISGSRGLKLHVGHLNHGLRMRADGDAKFVQREAARLGWPCTVKRRDVGSLAARIRMSIEETGRLARFSFFHGLALSVRASLVALGHTGDDQVETVLLRLLRGASASGLSGIAPVRRLMDPFAPARSRRSIWLIRPLLARSRKEVEEYLARRRVRPRRDPSNLNRKFMRNRIRHELLPSLESRYNPGIRKLLVRTAQVLAEDDELLESMAQHAVVRMGRRFPGGYCLQRAKLSRQPLPIRRRALRLAALAAGADPRRLKQSHLDAMVRLASSGSGEYHLPAAHVRATVRSLLISRRSG